MQATKIPKIELKDIRKAFPGVLALSHVNFAVDAGSVHVICGENGAGKSTLMKIINGVYQADEGEILIDGARVHIRNPQEARELGIAMIFQELNFVPEMSVEENLFLGREPLTKIRSIDWKLMRSECLRLLESEGLHYAPDTKLKDLTVSDIQMLEILKAISWDAKILIMDEPTSAITTKEVEHLLAKVGELRAKGIAVIYISHKMEEIFRIADQITILRDGSVVESKPVSEYNIDKIISLMVGRQLSNVYPKEPVPIGEIIFEANSLSYPKKFHNVSFCVRAGEVIGFAGLVGAGRSETARAIFGLDPLSAGTVQMRGKTLRIKSVQDAIRNGIAMLSEDRRRYGIIPVRSVRENASLANLMLFFYRGYLHSKRERETIGSMCARVNVKTPTLETTIDALSGGNQQKVVFSKWLLTNADVLFLDEPTRGIDVGAKYEIYKLINELAREGKSIVVISSELPELMGICDRIYVMAKGEIRGELSSSEFSQEGIMRLATMTDTRSGS